MLAPNHRVACDHQIADGAHISNAEHAVAIAVRHAQHVVCSIVVNHERIAFPVFRRISQHQSSVSVGPALNGDRCVAGLRLDQQLACRTGLDLECVKLVTIGVAYLCVARHVQFAVPAQVGQRGQICVAASHAQNRGGRPVEQRRECFVDDLKRRERFGTI